MIVSSGSGLVWAEYQQWYLLGEDDVPGTWSPDPGLIAPLDTGGAIVFTGISLGNVPYTWEIHDRRPPVPDGWEESKECLVQAGAGGLHVLGWGSMSFDESDLAFAGPGTYVVRCSASGRQLDWDDAPDVVRERVHLEVWQDAS